MIRLKYDPQSITIDQTVLCNQACDFCWRRDPGAVRREIKAAPFRAMSFEMFARIIDAAAEVETLHRLSLSGPMGEPALLPDLAARGAYAAATGRFDYRLINTNGFALDRHDAGEILDAFTRISVSLDTIDAAAYDAVHGVAGQFARVVANLEALADAKKKRGHGAELRVRFTETRDNLHQWPAFEAKWSGIVDGITRRAVHSFMDTFPGLANNAGAVLCNQPRHVVNFSFEGRLTTCCVNYARSPSFGHIDDGRTLKELWESPEFEAWRAERHAGICRSCSGLGGPSQRPSGRVSEAETQALNRIREIGEARFYDQ